MGIVNVHKGIPLECGRSLPLYFYTQQRCHIYSILHTKNNETEKSITYQFEPDAALVKQHYAEELKFATLHLTIGHSEHRLHIEMATVREREL